MPRSAVDPVDATDVLAELVKADLRCRFERGQSPAVADYLDSFPELRAADSRVLSSGLRRILSQRRAREPHRISTRFAIGIRTGRALWSRSFSTIACSARRGWASLAASISRSR